MTQVTASGEALFRYVVVSAVRVRMVRGMSQAAAVEEVAGTPLPTIEGVHRRIAARTIYRWLSAWTASGIAGLEPAVREPKVASRVLSNELLGFVAQQKAADPRASLPEILKRAREHQIVDADEAVDRVTLWRAVRRMGVPTKRRKKLHGGDTRSFEYPHRMQMLLCDGKHFRAGATRAKRVALFFLDDATRLGLHVVVGTAESAALFLRGLYEMVRRHGLFDAAYLDHGPGFIANDTAAIVERLGALLVLGTVGYPPGRGKIERFNQRALASVLSSMDKQQDLDTRCEALELRLSHWLRERYNHELHEGLGKDVTPWQRWSSDQQALRFPEDDDALRSSFVLRETRKATKDHLVPWYGVDLELPKGLAGTEVELHHQVLDDTVRVLHEGRLVRLFPVDRHANAVAGRGRTPTEEPSPTELPPSAAELAFRRDLRPLVGPDGGFSLPNEEVP